MDLLILAGVCLLVSGVVLMAIALRGRRVDYVPHCSACRFELLGLQPIPVGVDRACPECGENLAPEKAVYFGRRRKASQHVAHAWMLIAAAVVVGGPPSTLAVIGSFTPARQPNWYLVMSARQGPTGGPTIQQLRELIRRQSLGVLSRGDVDAIVEQALAVQERGGAGVWDPLWGDIIETARARGEITTAQLERYARQAVPTGELVMSPRVDAASSVVVGVKWLPARVGSRSTLAVSRSLQRLHAGAAVVTLSAQDTMVLAAEASASEFVLPAGAVLQWGTAEADGATDVRAVLRVVVSDAESGKAIVSEDQTIGPVAVRFASR